MIEKQEIPAAKEIFSSAKQTVALQTRLILGKEALRPNKINLSKITSDQLSEISHETVSKINKASTKERADYWKGKGTFDEQLKSWCNSMIKYMNDPRYTEIEALNDYNRYFGANKSESNINIYVDMTIKNLTQNGKINFDLLNQELPRIKKMAHIFGDNSSEIIESLILARAKLTDPNKRQELVDQVNEEKTVDGSPTLRLNWLNPDEERLLKWLSEEDKQQVTITENEPLIKTQEVDSTIKIDQTQKPSELKPKTEPIQITLEKKETPIKIIDHSDKPIDSSFIIEVTDQPIIVRVTDLPEKKLIIKLDQTAFDIIGEPSRFLKTNLTEKISASKLVPLPSLSTQEEQFFYFTVAKHNDDNTVSYSNCFVSNKNGVYQPVGHIDYTTKIGDPSKGICHMSNLHEILQSIPLDKLPPHLKTFQSFFSDNILGDNIMGVAVEINNQYRSQKLGKALWYFTLAQSEFDGLKEVEIVGDITVYNDPLDQVRSFYQHLGAQPQLYLQHDPKQDKIEGKERLVASSFLDITQISKIKELLEPIKIIMS